MTKKLHRCNIILIIYYYFIIGIVRHLKHSSSKWTTITACQNAEWITSHSWRLFRFSRVTSYSLHLRFYNENWSNTDRNNIWRILQNENWIWKNQSVCQTSWIWREQCFHFKIFKITQRSLKTFLSRKSEIHQLSKKKFWFKYPQKNQGPALGFSLELWAKIVRPKSFGPKLI